MNRCPTCHTDNPPGVAFCVECGTRLAPSAVQSAQTVLQGRYVLGEKIGQGGMGAVYRAGDMRLNTATWAIKEMSEAAITRPLEREKAREAFRREAEMLAGLAHPNLPRVIDHFEQDGRAYLVMEFVPGETLLGYLQRAGLPQPLPQVLVWVRQLCDVLGYLHAQQPPIIFRDLKPSNIMLTPQGQIKLIDFGIARLFKPGQERDTQAFGTIGYSAPEQYGRGQTDARADVYALGVLVHQLVTGYDPAATPFQLPPAAQVNPSVPAALSQALARATSGNPEERYPSIAAFRDALLAAESQAGGAMLRPPDTLAASATIGGEPRESTGLAQTGRWLGLSSVATMGIAAAMVGISTLIGGAMEAMAGYGILLAVLPLAGGPVALVLGVAALTQSVTQQTQYGRRHATIGVVSGVVTVLLCCVIAGIAAASGES